MLKKLLLPGLTIGALVVGAAEAQAIELTVDNFDEGAYSTLVDSSDTMQSASQTGSTSNIIGGQRDVTIEYTGDPDGFGITDLEITAPDPGQLNVSNGSDSESSTRVEWSPLLSQADLAPYDTIAIDVVNLDLSASLFLAIDSFDEDAGFDFQLAGAFTQAINTLTTIEFDLNEDFISLITGEPGRPNNIELLTLFIDGESESDITIDRIYFTGPNGETTPEPSVILGSAVALGLGAWSKKKKN